MVANPAEVYSPHSTDSRIGSPCTNSWIRADELYCRSHGLLYSARCSRSIHCPPPSSLANLTGRSANEPRRQWAFQPRRPSSRKNSSAGTTSPLSPSAIALRRAASSLGPRVKVSSFSGARTVTVEPSANDSPDTSILPSTTLPVVIRMKEVYSSVSRTVQNDSQTLGAAAMKATARSVSRRNAPAACPLRWRYHSNAFSNPRPTAGK